MGRRNDLSPRKIGQIKVLLTSTTFKQNEIAAKLLVSPQSVLRIKKKMVFEEELGPKRVGRCGRKKVTTPRTDRKIVKIALNNRRASCKNISSTLAADGLNISRRTVNRRLLTAGLKAYRPRKKPRLTDAMKKARFAWAKEHINWTIEDWEQVIIIFNCLVW